MKLNRTLAGVLIALAICAIPARSQNASAQTNNENSGPVIQLKLQIVLTEMDGAKKLSSLPYTLRVLASAHQDRAQFRAGFRIPIRTGGKDNEVTMQYIDVGTNIFSSAKPLDSGRYQLSLQVERSMLYVASAAEKPIPWAPSEAVLSGDPIIQQFSNNGDLVVRDGQTIQATVASDPVTGHVMTMDVTVTVEK